MHDARLLLIRRASVYGKGNWQIPGGFIEREETLEQAVVREVAEEAGVVGHVRGVLALRSRFDGTNSTYVVFLLDWISGEPTPDGKEADRAEWFSLESMKALEKLPAINLAVAKCALDKNPKLLSGMQVEAIGGGKYTLFVG